MGRDEIKWRKRDIVQILNHGFDGNARRSGKPPEELFEGVVESLREINATNDEVDAGLHTARTAHDMLLEKGVLTEAQAGAANAAVDDFIRRFSSRKP